MHQSISTNRTFPDDVTKASQLPKRQLQVLKGIASGKQRKEIASELKLSTKTVEYHLAAMTVRLGVFDVASLTRIAIRSGLIEP